MKITLKIEGVNKVVDNFKKFGREGKKVVAEITEINAKEIEAEAKRTAPFKFGKLRQSIIAEMIKLLAWTVTAYESYASFQEFGTSKMAAQPFLYPAWKKQIKIYLRDLNKSLERLGKKYG